MKKNTGGLILVAILLLLGLVLYYFPIARIIFVTLFFGLLIASAVGAWKNSRRNRKFRRERAGDKKEDFVEILVADGVKPKVAEYLFELFLNRKPQMFAPRKNDNLAEVYDFYDDGDIDWEIRQALIKLNGKDNREESYKYDKTNGTETVLILAKEINKYV